MCLFPTFAIALDFFSCSAVRYSQILHYEFQERFWLFISCAVISMPLLTKIILMIGKVHTT